MNWTEAADARLLKLWNEGYSAYQIGVRHEFKCSRSAIVGRIYRLKLAGKAPGVRTKSDAAYERQMEGRIRRRLKPRKPKLRVVSHKEAPEAPQQAPTCPPVHFMDREAWQCVYPLSEPTERMLVCGAMHKEGSSYCTYHHSVAYQKGTRKDFDRIAFNTANRCLGGKLHLEKSAVLAG